MQIGLRDIILLAITVAAVIIIVRTIMNIPVLQRTIETFIGGSDPSGALMNSLTECPAGSQIYMYEGAVYCCEGLLNPDADTLQRSCKPPAGTATRMLCTLGPNRNGVVNCLETLGGKMQEKGEQICPPSLPNFCQGPAGSGTANGRCCAAIPNIGYTDCMPGANCDVSSGTNYFLVPADCRFQRATQLDTPCPKSYTAASQYMSSGAFQGATLIGCSTGSENATTYCYSQNMLNNLLAVGYAQSDVNNLTVCNYNPSS
jgi:hypothetical protein